MRNRIILILVYSILYVNFLFSQQDFQGISGLNTDNYPRVDGSTSTEPLNTIIACKLLGWRYEWRQDGGWQIVPNPEDVPTNFFSERIKSSQTHNSIINLIDNKTDIIVSSRKMSQDEKDYAENLNALLIETPIALDALVFLLNKNNPVNSLTVKQVQDIYLGNIKNWNEVGGEDSTIKPFIRNANSGSQEMMKEFVMDYAGIPEWEIIYTDDEKLTTMQVVFTELYHNPNGICFTPYYYKEFIIRDLAHYLLIKSLAINGIMPSSETIKNGAYPFITPVYVMIRSDLDLNSMAYKLYEWLQTKSGKDVIDESGYVPYQDSENSIIFSHKENDSYVYPNPAKEGFYIKGVKQTTQINLFDFSGRKIFFKMITDNNYIDISHLQKGFYIIDISTRENSKQYKILKE